MLRWRSSLELRTFWRFTHVDSALEERGLLKANAACSDLSDQTSTIPKVNFIRYFNIANHTPVYHQCLGFDGCNVAQFRSAINGFFDRFPALWEYRRATQS